MTPEARGNAIDRLNDLIGRLTSWLTLLMTLVMFVIVVMRYLFDSGFIWIQESVTWMHAVVFMLGAAYALRHEEHVRVDIFYRSMSARRRAWVDIAGVILFLLPLCAYLLFESFDFVLVSWSMGEVSRESGGMPYPFIPILKSVLLVMPVLLALQGLSLLHAATRTIRGSRSGEGG